MPGNVPLVLMVTVMDRKYSDTIVKLFTDEGVVLNFLALARGTADSKILDYFGLGETEKAILFSKMPFALSRKMLKKLTKEISLHKPGRGIAFTVPICGISNAKIANHLKSLVQMEVGEHMEQSFHHNLIVAVANRGFTGEVMDAAKSAEATGGTVVHARGVGSKDAEKFFGITILPEKELILILAKKELTQSIMDAIVTKAGFETEAKAITFSLPVNGVAGLTGLLQE